MFRRFRNRKGFSLIELLIVIAIIGIIATIAIPILLSARQGAIREKARNSLRSIVSAEAAFYATNGSYGNLDDLGDPSGLTPAGQTPYLDAVIAAGSLGAEIPTVTVVANPDFATGFLAQVTTDSASIPDYQADETGVITEF